MGIWSYWKLFDNALWRNASLLEVPEHGLSGSLLRTVRGGNLDGMVLRVVISDGLHVCGHLTILKLLAVSSDYNKRDNPRTWRTVTGCRAPWSSYMAVIPRFRAIRPVRIEFGVHLTTGCSTVLVEGVALLARVAWTSRTRAGHDCDCNFQSLSILRASDGGKQRENAFRRLAPEFCWPERRP